MQWNMHKYEESNDAVYRSISLTFLPIKKWAPVQAVLGSKVPELNLLLLLFRCTLYSWAWYNDHKVWRRISLPYGGIWPNSSIFVFLDELTGYKTQFLCNHLSQLCRICISSLLSRLWSPPSCHQVSFYFF